MIAPSKTRTAWRSNGRGGAFTLIELLVVIGILAVLVALVVGVGQYLREKAARDLTNTTMSVLKSAIDSFYDSTWTDPTTNPPTVHTNEYPPDKQNYDWMNPEPFTVDSNTTYQAGDGIQVLYMYLTGKIYANKTFPSNPAPVDLSGQPAVKAASEKIRNLSKDAFNGVDHNFKDGWGMPFRYRIQSGKPVLTSAGPDMMFTINPNRGNESAATDNIRSDGR